MSLIAVVVGVWLADARSQPVPMEGGAQPTVVLLEIQGGIGPANRDYLVRGLQHAADENAAAVVLRIDTPGGLDAATRDINQAILASPVPVIGWVAPQGARAASAGTYILYACHLAAMAPATSLGAATPVSMGGATPFPGSKENSPTAGSTPSSTEGQGRNDDDEGVAPGQSETADTKPGRPEPATTDAMSHKVVNDAVAYLRSLAELRGRDAAFAEDAVRNAATLTADQALKQNVVEIIATDMDSLLGQADGREVRLRDGATVLATRGAAVTTFAPDWRFSLLAVLTNPSVAYMLLLAGMYGLLLEGYSPGAVVPGVVGAICLLLALYALQVLPVNYAGVALIALGVLLMGLEFSVPSFGALGIGGVVALVVGSLILFDTDVPGFGVPGQLILGVGIASALAFMGLVWVLAGSRTRQVSVAAGAMVGQQAIAIEDFIGRGHVRIRGEIWQAESVVPVERGQSLQVQSMDGLVLHVTHAGPAVAVRSGKTGVPP
ncbi:nodulation protein NfeD [Lysobacter sp. A03]|uniref:NfeD family protein n=1 Tax=Lysobacter sp. A03 TaxID=1199154 RepID=UPI0005B6E39E|nr:nodulation protein NfeD [Lysobacter sp. A03]KIQ96099.1 putative membrane-bound ClpP-class protease [Lysobacter sp. A03]